MIDVYDLAAAKLAIQRRRALLPTANRWQADPVGWVHERLGETMWSAQRQIAESVRDNRRTTVHAAFDCGKSYTAARLALWWIDTHRPGEAFVVTTAPSYQQVRAILWREMNKAHAKGKLIGRMTQMEWWIGGEMVAFGRKPQDYVAEAFAGIHAANVLVVLDEAAGVPANLWDQADGLIANEASRILAIGNPLDPGSRFAEVCTPGSNWNTIGISAFDTPAFTGEEIGRAHV